MASKNLLLVKTNASLTEENNRLSSQLFFANQMQQHLQQQVQELQDKQRTHFLEAKKADPEYSEIFHGKVESSSSPLHDEPKIDDEGGNTPVLALDNDYDGETSSPFLNADD